MPVVRPETVIGETGEYAYIGTDALQCTVAATGRVEVNVVIVPRHMCLKTSPAARAGRVDPERRTGGDVVFLKPEREGHAVVGLGRVQERGIIDVDRPAGFGR